MLNPSSENLQQDPGMSNNIRWLPNVARKQHQILVVDDDAGIVALLETELGGVFKVFTATSGAEALAIMEKEPIQLVVADQRMPEMTGIELMKELVAQYPNTMRILMAGDNDVNVLVDAINEGQVYRYITKPWEPEALKTVVQQGLEKYELLNENHRLVQNLKQINRELNEALEDLNKAQHEQLLAERLSTIEKMANMIVHDYKNPLTSIIGFSELLISSPVIHPETYQFYYKKIYRESQRIFKMTREILAYVNGDDPDLCLEPHDLKTFTGELRAEIEHFLKGSGIRTGWDIQNTGTLLLDAEKIKRVFHNLADNGREAMQVGGKLALTVTTHNDQACFRLTDTGHGILEEYHHHIFEPFFTSGKKGGSGMGLAIAKLIVEAHQGEIHLESSDDTGTTFCIQLPLFNDAEKPVSSDFPPHVRIAC